MPQVPYPITAESVEDLKTQIWHLIREVFEGRIGGLLIGDVFSDGGDVLTINLVSSGGLTKSSSALMVQVTSTGGLNLVSGGLAAKLKAGGGITSDATGLQVDPGVFVPASLFDANTILKADSDNTPEALTVGTQTVVGRVTGGEIAALTGSQVRDITGLQTTDSPGFVTVKLSGLTDDYIPYHVNDSTGLANGPTKTAVDSAVSASHTRAHTITGTSDHTSSATAGQMLKADASGLPIDATNTDSAVAAAVSASHSRAHTINSSTDHTDINLAAISNNDLMQWDDPSSKWLPKSIDEVILNQAINPGNITIANGGWIGQAAGPLIAFDDTNNYLEITGGNVGIGTTGPTGKLTVATTDDTTPITIFVFDARHSVVGLPNEGLAFSYSATSNMSYIHSVEPLVEWKGLTFDASNYVWQTSMVTKMVMDTNGNVGIGTASPGSTLDVKGTLRLSGATSGYIGLAPAAAAGSVTYTLPSADGAANDALVTNGSGTLSWASAGSDFLVNQVFS